MIHLAQISLHHDFNGIYLLKGNVGLFQLAVLYLIGEDPVHERGNALLRVVSQCSGSGLDGVAQHQDDLLLSGRGRSRIQELLL